MVLSSEQVQNLIKNPANKEQLNRAILHEDRVKFCVKKCLETDRPLYTNTHLFKIENLLPAPKYAKYVAELSFPLPIMETAEVIYSGLYKIFDAQNKTIYPTLTDRELEVEFTEYLQESGFNDLWKNEAWQAFRNQPNCVMVVDMDTVQIGTRPEPRIYPVDITSIKDIGVDDNGDVTYLIFVNQSGNLVVIDDEKYCTYLKTENKDQWETEPANEGYHQLGYCPAIFLIQDALDNNQPILKESPVTKVLYSMEKLLFRIISGENLEDYAGYPIHVMQQTQCTYGDEHGNRCNSGFITYEVLNAITNAEAHGAPVMAQRACPACSSNHLVGAGSAYEAQPDIDGAFDLDNVIKIIPAPVETLDFVSSSVERRKNNIIQSCIGVASQEQSGQAKNEKQITSMFEDRQTILMRTKRNFERAIKFCMDTMGTLRYEGAYISSTVNLGTRFLLATVSEIQARLDGAVNSSAPQYEIALIRDEMNSTEYANNPRMIERIKILQKLEPYPNLDITDITTLYSANKVSQIVFDLKYNFTNFIAQFEDENGDIVDFGSLLSMSKKIEIIKTKILEYVKDYINANGGPAAADSTGLRPGETLPVAS